jgi:hypothetical protein
VCEDFLIANIHLKMSQLPPLKHSGLLTKRGHIIKNWKLRYFVLEKGKLGYFKDGDPSTSLDSHNGRKLQGTFPLDNVICGGRTIDDPLKLYLVDIATEKELYVRASNAQEAMDWEEHILRHAEYAKGGYGASTKSAAARRTSVASTISRSDTSSTDDAQDGRLLSTTTEVLQFENFEEMTETKDLSDDIDVIERDIQSIHVNVSGTSTELTASLQEIAKEIKRLEGESKKEQDTAMREFNKTEVPVFKITVKDLELRINALKKRIKSEFSIGEAHIKSLEAEMDGFAATLDQTKCKLYFPCSIFAVGSAGVYCAFDDVWLEQLSGGFNVQLFPSATENTAQIVCLLHGAGVIQDTTDSGLSMHLLIDNFKLRGDTGKGVPPLTFERLEIAVTVAVTIILTFNEDTKSWSSPSDQFKVNIISFKGPFGINRSVVSTVLTVAIPIVKHLLLKNIPEEIGMLLRTLPTHTKVAGEFRINGALQISSLSDYMHNSASLCEVLGMTPDQVRLFMLMQKSMHRSTILKSILQLVEYKRSLEKTEHWEKIVSLWDQAAVVYFAGLCDASDNNEVARSVLSFRQMMHGVVQVLKNPVTVSVQLSKLELGIGLLDLNRIVRSFFERIVDEANRGIRKLSEAEYMSFAKILGVLNDGNDAVEMVARNLDFIRLSLGVNVHGGPDGEVRVLLKEVEAQSQMSIWSGLPKDMSMGMDYVIPMMVNVHTRQRGSLDIKIFHAGSRAMLEAAVFAEYMKRSGCIKAVAAPLSSSSSAVPKCAQRQASSTRLKSGDRGSGDSLASLEAIQRAGYGWYLEDAETPHRDVDELLKRSPGPMEAHELVHVRVTRPKVLFVVDGEESVTLQPGAPLFILQVGPTHSTNETKPVAATDSDFMTADEDEDEEACSMMIQTASKIRVLAQIPDIRVLLSLPALLRFVNDHFRDVDELAHLVATMIPAEKADLVKYIGLIHQLIMFINKQLLVPNALDVEVNLAVDIKTCPEKGVQLYVKPPDRTQEGGRGEEAPVQYAVKLNATVQIGSIVQDAMELMQDFMAMQADELAASSKSSAETGDSALAAVRYTVTIKSLSCRKLINVESILGGNKNDPYVIFRVGDRSFQTTAKKGAGSSCQWKAGADECMDSFTFAITDVDLNADGRTFDAEVNVFDWNKRASHAHIGRGFDRVAVTRNADCGSTFQFTVDLQTKKYDPAGEVEVEYELSSEAI